MDTPRALAPASSGIEEHRPVDVPALTGLRAFAAAAVVLFHLRALGFSLAPGTAVAKPLLDGGALGVLVFFVLSGFVIAHTYAHRLATPAPRAVRDYLVARLARLYPVHLVTFLLKVALLTAGVAHGFDIDPDPRLEHTVSGFIGNLLMLQLLPGIPPWNGPSWSITCELVAYLVFPLFAARLLRARWVTAVVLAAAVLSVQVVLLHQLRTATFTVQGWLWIVGGFPAGALLWVVWRRRLRPGRWADAAVIGCLLGSAWLLWHGHFLLSIPLLAVMVPAVACATGPIGALLAHPITQWGGRISYALYLVHVPIIMTMLALVVPADAYVHHATWKAVLVLGGTLVAAVAAAALLHHGVEEPARRWLRRRFATAPKIGTRAERPEGLDATT